MPTPTDFIVGNKRCPHGILVPANFCQKCVDDHIQQAAKAHEEKAEGDKLREQAAKELAHAGMPALAKFLGLDR